MKSNDYIIKSDVLYYCNVHIKKYYPDQSPYYKTPPPPVVVNYCRFVLVFDALTILCVLSLRGYTIKNFNGFSIKR